MCCFFLNVLFMVAGTCFFLKCVLCRVRDHFVFLKYVVQGTMYMSFFFKCVLCTVRCISILKCVFCNIMYIFFFLNVFLVLLGICLFLKCGLCVTVRYCTCILTAALFSASNLSVLISLSWK